MKTTCAPDCGSRKITVECMDCRWVKSAEYDHNASDVEIKRRLFPRWKVLGVYGAKRTLCPQCR